jgi:hypothetical protein
VTWAGTFALEALGVLVQEVAVRAAIARAVRFSMEDVVVRVAGDVGEKAKARVRCRVSIVIATARLVHFVLGRKCGQCLGCAVT